VIGVNVQVSGFDFDAHFENVRLRDNGRDVIAEALEVPSALEVLDSPDLP